MRRHLPSYKYPTIPINITWVSSTVCAYFSRQYFSTKYLLIIATIGWGLISISHVIYQRFSLSNGKVNQKTICKYFIIHTIIFILGFSYTSLCCNQASTHHPANTAYTSYQLSAIDHCKLKAQAVLSNIEKEMQTYHIKQQDLAVISAMALADRSLLTPTTKNVFSITGASHILAVSGLHIGIIFQLIFLLFGGKRHRLWSISLSLFFIWSYVFMIGAPASAIRSSAMISIYGFALISRRKQLNINCLSVSFMILTFINPLYIFEVSFQLSFLAVGSILLFYHLLHNVLHPCHRLTHWAWSVTAMSISVQIGTLPIIAYYFGRISCYSILTNFIAIPAATLILYFTLSFILLLAFSHIGIFPILFSELLEITAKILGSITHSTNNLLSMLSSLPEASIEHVKINTLQLCLIYIGIAAGYILIRKLHQYHSRRSHLPASYRKHYNSPASQI